MNNGPLDRGLPSLFTCTLEMDLFLGIPGLGPSLGLVMMGIGIFITQFTPTGKTASMPSAANETVRCGQEGNQRRRTENFFVLCIFRGFCASIGRPFCSVRNWDTVHPIQGDPLSFGHESPRA